MQVSAPWDISSPQLGTLVHQAHCRPPPLPDSPGDLGTKGPICASRGTVDSVGFRVRVNSGMYARYVSAPTWHGIAEPLRRLQGITGPWKVEQGQEWHLHLQLVLGLFFDWHKCNLVFGHADETDSIISGAGSDAVHEDICHICIYFFCCYCLVESSK